MREILAVPEVYENYWSTEFHMEFFTERREFIIPGRVDYSSSKSYFFSKRREFIKTGSTLAPAPLARPNHFFKKKSPAENPEIVAFF